MRVRTMTAILACAAAPAFGGLSQTHQDLTAGNTIGTYNYSNGGGAGFGGAVGGGTMSMDSDASNLYLRFSPGAGVGDLVTILLDTRAGGFTDAGMNDNADGGRRASSQQSINADDAYDAEFLPDFAIIMASFGTVYFELTATPNSLNFLDFNGTGTFPRDYSVSLASLGSGMGQNIDYLVAYIGDSGFGSNESLPAYAPLNSGANPGFDAASAGYGNYNRFITLPSPSAAALLGLAGLVAGRRRR